MNNSLDLRIKDGEKAKEFSVENILGQPVNLSDYRGRYVLLSFFRFASCPFCNLRVHQLIQRYPEWQTKGLEVVAVFESSPETMLKFVGKQVPPFPLIGDPANHLYRRYSLEKSWRKFLLTYLRPTSLLKTLWRGFYGGIIKGYIPTKIDAGIHRMPADFLIGPEGKVLKAYYGNYPADHLPFEQIESLVKEGAPVSRLPVSAQSSLPY